MGTGVSNKHSNMLINTIMTESQRTQKPKEEFTFDMLLSYDVPLS